MEHLRTGRVRVYSIHSLSIGRLYTAAFPWFILIYSVSFRHSARSTRSLGIVLIFALEKRWRKWHACYERMLFDFFSAGSTRNYIWTGLVLLLQASG